MENKRVLKKKGLCDQELYDFLIKNPSDEYLFIYLPNKISNGYITQLQNKYKSTTVKIKYQYKIQKKKVKYIQILHIHT